ncbi:testis-expressed protein 10 homolog isoform X1 [Glandiceps talaboti]
MGRSARKKKEKRKDFQKVKLKVGKKKALPDNVTDVNFKSRAIHLKEQLKSDTSQPTNQRKQNIQELFTHLNHYNASMRQESVAGLKDLFVRHPNQISIHLSSIIEQVSSLFTDTDSHVRSAAIGLLQFIAPHISTDQVMPFFPILNSHLCCAMTHIFEDIQLDSLKVLDLTLQHFPALVTKHSKQLLPNFVDQISRQSGGKASSADAPARALTINPTSKLSSQKWRAKVLQRLCQFLQALLVTRQTSDVQRDDSDNKFNAIHWSTTNPVHVQLYMHTSMQPNIASSFTLRPTSSIGQDTGSEYLSTPEDSLTFIHNVVPILLQIWVEANPGLLATNLPGNQLSSDAMETFHGILSILKLLWKQMSEITSRDDVFILKLRQHYFKDFHHHLLTCFPYASHHPVQHKRQTPVTEVILNLCVCEVMSYFITEDNVKGKWVRVLTDYISELLQEKKQLTADNLQMALQFVQRLLQVLEKSDILGKLLKSVFICYKNCHLLSQSKRLIIRFFSELVIHGNHGYKDQPILTKWLQGLPRLLLDLKNQAIATTNEVLHVINTAALQRCQPLLQSLQLNIDKIFDHTSGLLLSLPNNHQRQVIEFLNHVPIVTMETFQSLTSCCHDNRLDATNVTYMLHILIARYLRTNSSPQTTANQSQVPFQTEDFVRYLFSVLIGVSQSDLQQLTSHSGDATQTLITSLPLSQCTIQIRTQSPESFRRHTRITKAVCECLTMLSTSDQVWQVMESAIAKLLVQHSHLPVSTVYAVLYCINHLYPGNRSSSLSNQLMSDDLRQSSAMCCLAALFHTTQIYRSGCYDDESWEMTLMTLVIGILTDIDEIWTTFLENTQSTLRHSDLKADHVRGICLILVKLLQTSLLRDRLRQHHSQVVEVTQTIMEHQYADISSQWLTELKYERSIALSTLK